MFLTAPPQSLKLLTWDFDGEGESALFRSLMIGSECEAIGAAVIPVPGQLLNGPTIDARLRTRSFLGAFHLLFLFLSYFVRSSFYLSLSSLQRANSLFSFVTWYPVEMLWHLPAGFRAESEEHPVFRRTI